MRHGGTNARLRLLLVVVTLLGIPVGAWGDEAADTRTFGTTAQSVHVVHAVTFVPDQASLAANLQFSSAMTKFCATLAFCDVFAQLSLPAGASVTAVEIDGCVGVGGELTARIRRYEPDLNVEGVAVFTVKTSTFDFVPPACSTFLRNLTSPETIENRNHHYLLEVRIAGQGVISTSLRGIRVFYRLQVSPAPATARFNDVPTNHPFFAVIEALAATGITGGCSVSPPLFCPDDAVTRKQMAAFISKALGLHWAP